MATLTIRNVPEDVKLAIRKRAAERGVSMEQEARDVLAGSVNAPPKRASILAELKELGIRPKEPFDLKAISDEMWEEGLR